MGGGGTHNLSLTLDYTKQSYFQKIVNLYNSYIIKQII